MAHARKYAYATVVLILLDMFRIDRAAAGVVQITNMMTMVTSTNTSTRSSGLCRPRLLIEARWGVLQAPLGRSVLEVLVRALGLAAT